MRTPLHLLTSLLLACSALAQYDAGEHTFSKDGRSVTDKIKKYDFEAQVVYLEKNGRQPLAAFSEEDQAYILRWNQVVGFMSTMRFKMAVENKTWGRMKHEQTVTPYYMDAIMIPGKRPPNHQVVMAEDYKEYTALYMEGEGFAITLQNQNSFPIENIVVESKVYYEQERYTTPDSLFLSSENEYTDTVPTNKVRYLSESIPAIIPHEKVTMHSECAIIIDHQLDRNALTTTVDEAEEGDGGDEVPKEASGGTTTIDNFGEWGDHSRRRKGRVHGVWFRIGIKGPDGEMVWREITSPSSLDKKVNWDGFLSDQKDKDG